MNVRIIKAEEAKVRTDCLIIPFFDDTKPAAYSRIDEKTGALISSVVKAGSFRPGFKKIMLLHTPQCSFSMVLLLGMGAKKEITSERLRQAGSAALRMLCKQNISKAALVSRVLAGTPLKTEFPAAYYFAEGALLGSYEFSGYKKKKNDSRKIKSLDIISAMDKRAVAELKASVAASMFARDLVNTPSNEMTPSAMAAAAKSIKGVKVKTLDVKEARRLSMNAYLSVGQGSKESPRFIVIEYKGGKGSPIVLVGKSVTFDSGGISLKPVDGMEKMKYDMAGGAAVLGAMKAVSELKLKVNVTAILPAVENLPDGGAFRPGDVVRAINGSSIEVISTDAEGRLTLADAIGYAVKFLKPRAIVDIATLTGACAIALGAEAAAMMGSDNELMDRIKKASDDTYERVWQMPLFDEYSEYLQSDIADIKNSGSRTGSLMASAAFLKEFAGSAPWAHLDIAGTAWSDKERPYSPRGATGMGARLLLRLVRDFNK
ncbi:MAG: leucyl aminopeptidase [Nitrospiraceae bacterium]|nr:leucyl aminopeptidase [Nitrospiraceae bacterium]